MKRISAICTLMLTVMMAQGASQERLKFGDFDSWVVRQIKESAVIGGNTKTLYAIGPNTTITDGRAYVNMGGSPWATSNVMAKVMGVTKGSNAVFRDTRSAGNYCAKLSTIMETVKALGIINMDVLVSGSIFLGRVNEPISSTKNPYSKMEMGVPFTKRPSYLVYDYKVFAPNGPRVYSSGFGGKKTYAGHDSAEVYLFLQQRWEDAKGQIHAKRVGTGRERYTNTTPNWVNNHKMPIYYGNITGRPEYRSYMGLTPKSASYYARNSKGKMVPVYEEGWADADTIPTHLMIMASSGCGTAYIGTVGMTLWIDNVVLEY
ncbi:MAG: PCMD domain-containing protein [Muribaculaceae bacterium]